MIITQLHQNLVDAIVYQVGLLL